MIKAKRFWKEVLIEGSYFIALDGRRVKTPSKSDLCLPTSALAELVAEEWRAVEGEIKPEDMHFTKMSNSANDRIAKDRRAIEAHLAEYLGSDLICYRADKPQRLIDEQGAWDKWIAWAESFGIKLEVTSGIMPIAQAPENEAAALSWLSKFSDFQLVAVYEAITITGSFVLAMAMIEGALVAADAFALSRIDEEFQIAQWGEDEEATRARAERHSALLRAAKFNHALNA